MQKKLLENFLSMAEEAVESTPWGKIVFASVLPNVGGWAGGLITKTNIKGWYESLKFPPYRPPNWIFGPVWTSLYTGMGYASYLVYRDGGGFEGKLIIEIKGFPPILLFFMELCTYVQTAKVLGSPQSLTTLHLTMLPFDTPKSDTYFG